MIKIVVLFLFSLNLYALDSRGPTPASPEVINNPSNKVSLFAYKNTMDQILSDKHFIDQFTILTNAVNLQWPTISADLKLKAGKELDRYNVSAVFGLQGNKLKALGAKISDIELNIGKFQITADLYYRIEIRPSFLEGKQLRKDIYVIGLKGSNVISAGSEVRITFFREFDSKMEALFAGRPYGLREIPRNADDVIKKLKVQDGVRVEAFGNLEISDSVSKLTNSANLSAVLGYELFQGLFMLDIYKYSLNEVRARFMGTINRGTLKGGIGLNWLAKYNVGGILKKVFKDIFEVNLSLNITKSFNFYDEYPIETHVADYFFRFDSGSTSATSISKACNYQALNEDDDANTNRPLTSEAAFDELIGNVRSGRFISLFNPNLKEEALSAALLKNASKAETIACQDLGLPTEKRRVLHFFKGRMASDIFSMDLGPKISRLIKKKISEGHSEIFVASVEQNQDFNYYLLMNSFSKFDNSYLFGRWENEFITDLDALYQSDKNKNVVQFLDFVKRIQYKDKNLSESNLREIYGNINRSIPNNFPDRQVLLDLIPKSEQRDGLISLVYAFSNKIVFEIESMNKTELYTKLANFLETHPKRYLMNMPPDNPGEGGGSGAYSTFNEYVNGMYYNLVRFSDSQLHPKDRYTALRELMRTKAFTDYVFTEFLPSLISSDVVADAMSVQMSISSDSIALSELRIGNNRYSKVYSAVLLLRSLLNDRSLDLRLESVTSHDGSNNVNPLTIKGFKIAD